jgi:hypothetical protein
MHVDFIWYEKRRGTSFQKKRWLFELKVKIIIYRLEFIEKIELFENSIITDNLFFLPYIYAADIKGNMTIYNLNENCIGVNEKLNF